MKRHLECVIIAILASSSPALAGSVANFHDVIYDNRTVLTTWQCLQSLNVILKFTGIGRTIGIVRPKYLNNTIEQDYRFIKRITRPMLGFKAFHSAAATLAGIEVAHMIRKGQLGQTGTSAFKQFAALAE